MTTLTLTIPDAQTARVVAAFEKAYSYQPFLADGITPNPETKAQFMRRMIMQFIRDTVQAVEASTAAETARAAEMAKPVVPVT